MGKNSSCAEWLEYTKMLGYGELGGPPLSASEEYSLHSRYLAKANSLNLSEIAEMKIVQPDLGWMKRLQQILGRKHQRNLHVWNRVLYVDRLLQLFEYVPHEQLTIPDFVFQLSFRAFDILFTFSSGQLCK
ncbi:hypothetical protein BUALT_Bualt05G0145000 [Buddleja alternifolia]|uniref:Maturase K n=1 Tax=Buddleja alternifolia TaxID=168488 RepID=A0AAV6XR44_9LAMI|nr:hypothetical protein BUALT_Bualt05G0145000 [Buddleja alternifolia]